MAEGEDEIVILRTIVEDGYIDIEERLKKDTDIYIHAYRDIIADERESRDL